MILQLLTPKIVVEGVLDVGAVVRVVASARIREVAVNRKEIKGRELQYVWFPFLSINNNRSLLCLRKKCYQS